MSTGRNFDEIIRVLDSLQLHWMRGDIVTPSDWLPGQKVLVKVRKFCFFENFQRFCASNSVF